MFLLICFHWFQWEQAALAWGQWGQCTTTRSEAAPCFGEVRRPDGDHAFADSSWAQAHVPGPYVRPWGAQ